MKRRGFLKGLVAASMLSVGAAFPKFSADVKSSPKPNDPDNERVMVITGVMLDNTWVNLPANLFAFRNSKVALKRSSNSTSLLIDDTPVYCFPGGASVGGVASYEVKGVSIEHKFMHWGQA